MFKLSALCNVSLAVEWLEYPRLSEVIYFQLRSRFSRLSILPVLSKNRIRETEAFVALTAVTNVHTRYGWIIVASFCVPGHKFAPCLPHFMSIRFCNS